ncbi:ornithine cyclodeaminase family protein [Gelidibacter salicanalis]|uniref:Ornithine cyclodeaminase family protein n=1 Tax=Gelidibacter salicanalis TaxID=291193 RepID=A0A5C7ANK0_9FLAO|nr:ornithine cyclodeaminase family protein [Gelidibacter salicanalis]TXE10356.1 ornithine cyclodeaminase family protein [Gelidibacter salicanalis]
MKNIVQIDADFVENHTDFLNLIADLESMFANKELLVPMRHHHDFPNPEVGMESTLLLMPAWNPGKDAGVKIATVSPVNGKFNLPAIQGVYIYLDALKGTIKAIIEAKSLTVKRTAAASALASKFLSRKNSKSLLMIGTGALSPNLIKAHASVRPIEQVFVWGRNFDKARAVCDTLMDENFKIIPIKSVEEKISAVDIISCATLSSTPLVLGKYLSPGQHVDLVGAYRIDMREADDGAIKKADVFVDTFEGGLKESGDIVMPLKTGILAEKDIKADLFLMAGKSHAGRSSDEQITLFKSVGHALEDLAAAAHYYNLFGK